MNFNFPENETKFKCMLYSEAGTGKTVSVVTLLKVKGLKVRILCIENNALPAIKEGLRLHNIDSLEEGQLTITTITGGTITSTEAFQEQTDTGYYEGIVSKFMNFKGMDVATGKEVALGNCLNWANDTILVVDGLTMLEYSCATRGRAKTAGNKDPRAAFYAGQDLLKGTIFSLAEKGKGNLLLLAHSTQSDEVARGRHQGLTEIHPALGTRSVVSTHLGRFSNVFYARRNLQQKGQNSYVWTVAEPKAYTIARNIETKGKKYLDREVTLNNLPADFSYEGYNFFPQLNKAP